ncbi:hypothetical protein, partial [Corynebacterium variabile]|uniref:hypothetical protein n=1 Tax=Corynebacterium variabile TaxID=1727 RepID=UPI003BB0AC6B
FRGESAAGRCLGRSRCPRLGQYRIKVSVSGCVVCPQRVVLGDLDGRSIIENALGVHLLLGVYQSGVVCPQLIQQIVNLCVRWIIKGGFSAVIVVADYFCFRQLLCDSRASISS